MTSLSTLTICFLLGHIDRQRVAILSQPYTTEASRRLDELDAQADQLWAAMDATTPRTYGEA